MTANILQQFTATLPDEASSETPAVEIGKFALLGVRVHAAPVTSSLTFKVGNASGEMDVLKDTAGNEVEVTLGSTKTGVYTLNANDFAGFQYVKIISGSTETSEITLTLYGYEV